MILGIALGSRASLPRYPDENASFSRFQAAAKQTTLDFLNQGTVGKRESNERGRLLRRPYLSCRGPLNVRRLRAQIERRAQFINFRFNVGSFIHKSGG